MDRLRNTIKNGLKNQAGISKKKDFPTLSHLTVCLANNYDNYEKAMEHYGSIEFEESFICSEILVLRTECNKPINWEVYHKIKLV